MLEGGHIVHVERMRCSISSHGMRAMTRFTFTWPVWYLVEQTTDPRTRWVEG